MQVTDTSDEDFTIATPTEIWKGQNNQGMPMEFVVASASWKAYGRLSHLAERITLISP